MGKKKIIIAIIIFLLAVVADVLKGFTVRNHLMDLTVQELFIKFTLIPMIFSFIVPFLTSLVCAEKRTTLLSYLFALFLYLNNYIILDSYFTPEVIAQIMKNSNMVQEGVSISSSTDTSSMITTVITIFALCTIGIFFGKKCNSFIQIFKERVK